MLTVDFDRLNLQPGHRFLDLGAGAGRHSFEALKRGAITTSLDYSPNDLPNVKNLMWAMVDGGEVDADAHFGVIRGDALNLAFDDASFDRIIISEVLEHIADDRAALAEVMRVLKPGGILAATVPAWGPEKICWALSAEYHAPLSEGGHVRVYTETELKVRIAEAGLIPQASHRAHALHSPYWWLKCAVGPTNNSNALVQAYHRLLVWDIMKAPALTRKTEQFLNPVLGKSIVVYSRKPDTATKPRRSSSAGAVNERASA